jgi:hypothetical protein
VKKDFPGNLIAVTILEREIEYAKSCLREHDTGHIHTAISWLEHRTKELKNASQTSKLLKSNG